MKLNGAFVLLCIFLSFVTINATDNKKQQEHTYDDIVKKGAVEDQNSKTILVDEHLNIERDVVEPEYNEKKTYLFIADKDIPIEHIKAENDEKTKKNDEMFEEKKDITDSLKPEIVIIPNEVNKIKQPDMRLARQLSQYRGRQVFHMNVALHNALDKFQQEQKDDDAVAEERAVRRRKRVRRRNSKNRANRVQNNGHSANQRNTSRPKISKKKSLRRINNRAKHTNKHTKTRNKKNGFYNNGAWRGNRNKAMRNQTGKRQLNKKNGQRSPNQRASARRRKNRKTKISKKNININNKYNGKTSPKDHREQISENLRPGFVKHDN